MSERDTLGTVTRRRLLGGAAATGGALATAPFVGGASAATGADRRAVLPPMLRPGDLVRVVAPGYPGDARLARGVQVLESFGLDVEVGAHVFDRYGYLAGTDDDRLADLRDAFADPRIRGVFAARGGYGTQRVVDRLDPAVVRRDPKVFVGFSDLTSLIGRLWQGARLVSFYGPMVNWTDARTGEASIESLRAAIMTTEPVRLTRDPAEPSAAVQVPGTATGPLLGGNLTMLQTGYGTRDFPDLTGAILLFEDVDEAPYSYDRMLTQLRRAGALRRIAGIAIGQFTNALGNPGQWDAAGAVRDRVADLGVPVLGGLPIGHGPGQLTVPLGATATIDTAAGTLEVRAGVRAVD